MGNCKSSAAASGVVVAGQNGTGLTTHGTLKHIDGKGADASTVVTADASTVTTHRKPKLQIQTDGNVEVPNGDLALSPTAELSEATSKDSQETSSSHGSSSENQIAAEGGKVAADTSISVDYYIGTKDSEDDEEDIPSPPPGKPTSAQNTDSNALVVKGDAASAYSLVLPFGAGTIPTSVFQLASDYVMPEGVSALTLFFSTNTTVSADGTTTTKKSVWALDPATIVAGAASTLLGDDDAKAASTANTTITTLVKAEEKSTFDDAEVVYAPSDEVTVDFDLEDVEVDPEAVIVSYKQKASQWAIDDAMKGSMKRRGPRPEDCDLSSVKRKSKRSVASAKR